jgi:hypothetical protein
MLLGKLCIVRGELWIDPNRVSSQISDLMKREERATAFSQCSDFTRKPDIAGWVSLLSIR